MSRTPSVNTRVLRLAAVLLPAALLMHEVVYAAAGSGGRASHGYLVYALPAVVALAVAIALGSVLLPLLVGVRGARSEGLAPLALAGALIAMFAAQETTEGLLLGGGPADLLAALAAGWMLAPLALVLGALASVAARWLERAGDALVSLLRCSRPGRARRRHRSRRPTPTLRSPLAPLAFGLARRPPPSAPAT